jgi:archaemetzincin
VSVIYLVPVGTVETELLDELERQLERLFDWTVSCSQTLPDPAFAFDLRRKQYSSVAILQELIKLAGRGPERVLGVTERDLFIPMLSFIYGQAQLGGRVALISLARLRQEFYGLPANRNLLVSRATKECVHELGHTLGLVHCLEKSCPMSLATNIRQLDIKSASWCPSCEIIGRLALNKSLPGVEDNGR